MKEINFITWSADTKVFILSPADILKKNLSDRFNAYPEIELLFFSKFEELWQSLINSKCDLLFIDESIIDEENENTAQTIIEIIAIPIILISEYPPTEHPLFLDKHKIIRRISSKEISSIEFENLLRQFILLRHNMETSINNSALFDNQSQIIDNLHQPIIMWDQQGAICFCNKAAEMLIGLSADEMQGKDINSCFFSQFNPPFFFTIELCGITKTGLEFVNPSGYSLQLSLQFSKLPVLSSLDRSPGYVATIRDISDDQNLQNSPTENEIFLKKILDSSSNIIYIWDNQKKVIKYINLAVHEILGFTPEEVLQFKPGDWGEVFSFVDLPGVMTHSKQFSNLRDDEIVEYEYHLRNKQHEWFWFKSRETVFSRNENGIPEEILGSIVDITQLKLIQKRLEKRLQREALFSEITTTFLNCDAKNCKSRINESLKKVMELITPQAILIYKVQGKRLYKTHEISITGNPSPYPDQLKADHLKWIKETLDINIPFIFEPGMEGKPEVIKGIKKLFENKINAAGIFPLSSHNLLLGIIVIIPQNPKIHWSSYDINVALTYANIITIVFHNITKDRVHDADDTRYRYIEEKSFPKLICQFDKDRIINYVNDVFCEIWGYEKEELIGKDFIQFIPQEDQEYVLKLINDMNKNNIVHTLEQNVRNPTNLFRRVEWICRAFLDEEGNPKDFQLMGRDISSQKMVEEEILSNEQTNKVQTARLSSISELATGVAHQISNPLTTIIADAQILMQDLQTNDPARASAEAILEAGWQAQDVIRILKSISETRVEENETVLINETIEQALLLTGEYLLSSNVKISTIFDRELPRITGNSRDLTDTWINLLLLSHSAAKEGRIDKINIITKNISDDWIEVIFENNGKVFTQELGGTSFEPRVISEPSKSVHGFELLICREIISRHEGAILIEGSDFNTNFKIRLPKG